MELSSNGWPNWVIRKAETLRSNISRHRMSRATRQAIARSRRARSTCSWQWETSQRWLPHARLRRVHRKGYVENLSRPGGNITGIFVRQLELAAKRVELTREVFPRASVVGIAFDRVSHEQRDAAVEAARKLRLESRTIEVKGQQDYDSAFAAMDDLRGQPLILPAGPMFLRDREAIAQVLLERRIPSIAAFRENTEAGALISYGFDLIGLFRDIAGYVNQIARGAKPSEMPIEQSLRFHMAVNLKTAASLGISLSDSFVARANEVRE